MAGKRVSVFGAARVNTPARQILVDDQNLAYTIGVSGLSVIPVYSTGTAPRPAITAGNRGVVNSEDGTPNLRPPRLPYPPQPYSAAPASS